MASTYSNLKIEKITTGEQSGTWGTTTNNNLAIAIEEAIVGSADVTFASANVTLTWTDTNGSQTARNLRLRLTGTTGGARNLIVPTMEKFYIVLNECADAVTVKNATGTGVSVPPSMSAMLYNDGVNITSANVYSTTLVTPVLAATDAVFLNPLPVTSGGTGVTTSTGTGAGVHATSPTITGATLTTAALNGTLGATTPSTVAATSGTFSTTLGVTGIATFTAAPVMSALTASSAVATNASKALVSVTNTGSGNNVLATSPTIATPTITGATITTSALNGTLGATTPSTVAATSGTFSTTLGVTGVATFTAQPILSSLTASSAVATDASKGLVSVTNTGTGNNVLATSPTLVTPILGTPTSGTLTNCTGLPVATGVSGLGTGVATFLGTPSSANLAAAVTGETGTGALVFGTSPTLVTPALGTPASGVLTNCTGTASGLTAGLVTNGIYTTDFTNSNGATSGYAKLPNGLIIQWAYQTGYANFATRPFPITFPTAVVSVVVTGANTTQHWEAYTVYAWTTTTWTGYTRYSGDATMMIAIGY